MKNSRPNLGRSTFRASKRTSVDEELEEDELEEEEEEYEYELEWETILKISDIDL